MKRFELSRVLVSSPTATILLNAPFSSDERKILIALGRKRSDTYK